MDQQKDIYEMMELMNRPGFCVKDHQIVKVNQAAEGLFLTPGMDIRPLLLTGSQEYAAFEGGCLYLQLQLVGKTCGASVTRLDGMDLFLPDQEEELTELRAMALAARELRAPLNSTIAITNSLLPHAVSGGDPKVRDLLARLSRSLYQMQRLLGNMSDAGHASADSQQRACDIPAVFREIFQRSSSLLEHAGIRLCYEGPQEEVLGLMDADQMERAVLNILSNSVKFMPDGGDIHARLTRQGSFLRLSIQDSGPGIGTELLSSVFTRYLRCPGLEDSRYGIGLGMVLIRSAATSHGGVVLIDQPAPAGTRVTLTMAIRQSQDSRVTSLIADITGGRDPALIELSQILPVHVYEKEL